MTLRLHLNENTAGCSPAVIAAIRAIDPFDVANYPDYAEVTAACARWFGVPAEWVLLTNGLDEGLQLITQQSRRGRALVVEPAFEMYERLAQSAGLAVTRVFWHPDESFPLEWVLGATTSDTSAVFLTDPNNPTGRPIPSGVADCIASAAPQAYVLVDEAYAEFSGRTLIGEFLDRRRHAVVGRTFAKAFGLAALRAGALVAHPDTLARLRRAQPPFSLNISAVRALIAALEDRAWVDAYLTQVVESRDLLYALAARHDFRYWRSEANFVLIDFGADAPAIVAALAQRGILIKDRSRQPGCAGCVRITAGVVEHTRLCIAALEDVLASRAR